MPPKALSSISPSSESADISSTLVPICSGQVEEVVHQVHAVADLTVTAPQLGHRVRRGLVRGHDVLPAAAGAIDGVALLCATLPIGAGCPPHRSEWHGAPGPRRRWPGRHRSCGSPPAGVVMSLFSRIRSRSLSLSLALLHQLLEAVLVRVTDIEGVQDLLLQLVVQVSLVREVVLGPSRTSDQYPCQIRLGSGRSRWRCRPSSCNTRWRRSRSGARIAGPTARPCGAWMGPGNRSCG